MAPLASQLEDLYFNALFNSDIRNLADNEVS